MLRGSELVGRVVGGRYRLLRPVGSGASAHVYVAEDVRLKRRVALKVLHPALAQDKSFLRRFQAEAQTVAALRQPGIVRVYDWGEDGRQAYLAMELLEGGSLRGLLDSGHRLSVSQAAALGLDVAAALAYAHSRGLVHRDVKPANLLFDEEGHVSVADFGIARALAEASWTEPIGALMGTARYAAPEQLRGVALDGKADVYALALVIVEAVTGTVPFSLDTTLGGLIARASTPLPVPPQLGPLAPLLRRAGAADPELRLSAESVAEEIAAVAQQLRAPAPLPLPGLTRDLGEDLPDATELASGGGRPFDPGLSIMVDDLPVVVDSPPHEPEPPPPLNGAEATSPATSVGGPPAPAAPGPQGIRPAAESEGAPAPPKGERRRRRRWLRWLVRILLTVVVLALAGAGVGAGLYLARPPAPTYRVPALSGDSVATARALLAREHLAVSVAASQWSPTAARGSIISQYPFPGTKLLAKQKVSVTVSLGPEPVAVPSLATLDLAQARDFLGSVGLRLGHVTRHTSMTVPAGIIISWSHRGDRLLPASIVDVVVSAGKPMAVIPSSAEGVTFTVLHGELAASGFKVDEARYYSDTVAAGVVISTAPAPGTRHVVGSTVTVNVSLAPPGDDPELDRRQDSRPGRQDPVRARAGGLPGHRQSLGPRDWHPARTRYRGPLWPVHHPGHQRLKPLRSRPARAAFASPSGHYCPRTRSSWRRSRLVGRPAPRSRAKLSNPTSSAGGGGVWSM